jgi:hypothetical protein
MILDRQYLAIVQRLLKVALDVLTMRDYANAFILTTISLFYVASLFSYRAFHQLEQFFIIDQLAMPVLDQAIIKLYGLLVSLFPL